MNKELRDRIISNAKDLINAEVLPRNITKSQLTVFAEFCGEKNLSPFSKECYALMLNGKLTAITGIDGYRKIAGLTGVHAGTDEAIFNYSSDKSFRRISDFKVVEKPVSCLVNVYKVVAGQVVKFSHEARYIEFAKTSGQWPNMPFQMIAKIAEAFALKKAFPSETSGLSIEEEIEAMKGENNESLIEEQSQIINSKPEAVEVELEDWEEETISALKSARNLNSLIDVAQHQKAKINNDPEFKNVRKVFLELQKQYYFDWKAKLHTMKTPAAIEAFWQTTPLLHIDYYEKIKNQHLDLIIKKMDLI